VEAVEEDKYHVVATSSLSGTGTRVLKHGDSFAVFSRFGDVQQVGLGEQGLYHEGTRHLSRLRLRLAGHQLVLLSSTVSRNNLLLAVDLTNPDIYEGSTLLIPSGALHVFRSKFLHDAICYERIQISNFGESAVSVALRLDYDSDFVDLFEVRGTKREARGTLLPPVIEHGAPHLSYRGLDDVVRTTRIDFSPLPEGLSERHAEFRVHLEVKQTKELYLWVSCLGTAPQRALTPYESAFSGFSAVLERSEDSECSVSTANQQLNVWLNRSVADLRMMITSTAEGPMPYAGVPWYSTPFGRDALWTAIQSLWVNPELGAGVLRFLASTQATKLDAESDAEPGKIIHEMRDGEMAALGEVPFRRYYGSVDSTPLYLMLADLYYEATADRALIEQLWPSLLLGLEWMSRYGDADGDGFLEYGRRSKHGLLQQGWKDSHDSVFHHDGTLADGPIALCEVQGYAYAALVGMARLSRVLGHDELAGRLERNARGLQERFDGAFWCDDLGAYALALDGKKLPCRVRSSNAGQCLYTGIVHPARAARLAQTLMAEDMFSGWGIRTISAREQRYNPMSYHNGSVWPHDSAIVAAGLARYGHTGETARVLAGLFDASQFVDLHRVPELFCGFERRANEGPTLYPVACSPQSWAAGAPFMLLKALLGLRIDAAARRVALEHPVLPPFLDDIVIKKLRVGPARVDLRLHRYPDDVGVNVLRKEGDVEVVVVK